jgi:hypothetical protein
VPSAGSFLKADFSLYAVLENSLHNTVFHAKDAMYCRPLKMCKCRRGLSWERNGAHPGLVPMGAHPDANASYMSSVRLKYLARDDRLCDRACVEAKIK